MEKKKILIVESSDNLFLNGLKKLLKDKRLEFIRAKTLEEARAVFKIQNKILNLIIIDDCDVTESISLVREIKKSKFTNPILATCCYSVNSEKLRAVGATDFAHKDDTEEKVTELLKL
jgi:DNA-binding NtrC family response regulator